jgi:hypothetical protein
LLDRKTSVGWRSRLTPVSRRSCRWTASLLLVLLTAGPAAAQFGGGQGEVVLFLLTHRGATQFETNPVGAQNSPSLLSSFRVTDMETLPVEEVVPNFPARVTQVAVNEPDDRFELITQFERIEAPRTLIVGKSKVFTLAGLIRDENPGGQGPVFIVPGALAPFTPDVTVGPDTALLEFTALFWRPNPSIPPFQEVPVETVGPSPEVPPGLTGIEYQLTQARVPLFFFWKEMRKEYPGQSWPPGVFVKLIEEDVSIPSTVRLLRLRAGAKSPPFRIPARTHVFVLQGSVDIAPVGGATTHMEPHWHAYLPAGMWLTLANPKPYEGPVAAAAIP